MNRTQSELTTHHLLVEQHSELIRLVIPDYRYCGILEFASRKVKPISEQEYALSMANFRLNRITFFEMLIDGATPVPPGDFKEKAGAWIREKREAQKNN